MGSERRLAIVGCLALLLVASPAAADPSLSDRETARSLMEDGDGKRERGDLKGALKSFEAADAIMHVPTTALEVARTQAALGQLLEARETLARIQRMPAKPGEPAPFALARKTADTMNVDLGARLGSLTVAVTSEVDAPVFVTVDGENVPTAALGAPRKVNPGTHEVVARAGELTGRASVVVGEREIKQVAIALKRTAAPPPSPAVKSGAPASGVSTTDALVYGGFGVGAVGFAVGAITGIMALAQTGDIKDDCVGNLCPLGRQQDINGVRSLGMVSTVGFAVAAFGATVGILGVVLVKREATTARLEASPRWFGVTGEF